jgi:hypothetical protein
LPDSYTMRQIVFCDDWGIIDIGTVYTGG